MLKQKFTKIIPFFFRISVGSKDSDGQSSVRAQSEGPGGIIHSVQILTGNTAKSFIQYRFL